MCGTAMAPYAIVGNYTLVVPHDMDFNQSWLPDVDILGVDFKHLTLQRHLVNTSGEIIQG